MLHSYAFKNFQSFADRTEVSLTLNDKAPAHAWQARSMGGQRLTTALAVLGANGAGKTVALKPLVFASWFITHSFDAPPDSDIPLAPHFGPESEAPTEIEVEAEDAQGVLWRYVLHATKKRVVHESLHRMVKKFNYVFTRDLNDTGDGYIVKQQGFGMPAGEALKVRPNASLISTARQYGVEMANHLTRFNLTTNVDVQGRTSFEAAQLSKAAELFAGNSALRDQMEVLLKSWDLGLSGVSLHEITRPMSDGATAKEWVPFGVHTVRDGSTRGLHFAYESSGTQAAFVLLSRLLTVLSLGGVAVIDEMDADLHSHMIEPVLDLFANPATNPHNAQVIFSAHTPHVLNVLHKAQVLFVEKRNCESEAYRADTIKGLRADDNLFAKYMAGALGAVPQV
jgi:hypothetical protein